MRDGTAALRQDERVTLALRGLYEAHGYRKFTMNRFEAYDFYARYRDFLPSGQIISFTDLNGKLMALRPDVTLSIIKQAEGDARLYYTEPVYRPARGEQTYREAYQVGIEYIGQLTPYATLEVVRLAAGSLALIHADYVLDISHTGFLSGLLDGLPLPADVRMAAHRCIEDKNAHELQTLLNSYLSEVETQRLAAVAQLSGPFGETLRRAQALVQGPEMTDAIDALDALHTALDAETARHARLDFSIRSDAKYYSGLMLRGYIPGVPGAVLSGGRYDPLLRRMGKETLSAMGFALYFDELARFFAGTEDTAVDTFVRYRQGSDPAEVSREVEACIARGERVWAGMALPVGMTCGRVKEVL